VVHYAADCVCEGVFEIVHAWIEYKWWRKSQLVNDLLSTQHSLYHALSPAFILILRTICFSPHVLPTVSGRNECVGLLCSLTLFLCHTVLTKLMSAYLEIWAFYADFRVLCGLSHDSWRSEREVRGISWGGVSMCVPVWEVLLWAIMAVCVRAAESCFHTPVNLPCFTSRVWISLSFLHCL